MVFDVGVVVASMMIESHVVDPREAGGHTLTG